MTFLGQDRLKASDGRCDESSVEHDHCCSAENDLHTDGHGKKEMVIRSERKHTEIPTHEIQKEAEVEKTIVQTHHWAAAREGRFSIVNFMPTAAMKYLLTVSVCFFSFVLIRITAKKKRSHATHNLGHWRLVCGVCGE